VAIVFNGGYGDKKEMWGSFFNEEETALATPESFRYHPEVGCPADRECNLMNSIRMSLGAR
jgi:hypothetical protein